MKYINADRLRAEIEKRKQIHFNDYFVKKSGNAADYGASNALAQVLSLIDSLQQEQPDFPTTDEQIKDFLATHPKIKVPEKYKNPDWLLNKQEQPEMELEKFIERMNAWKTRYNHPDDIPIKGTMAFTARMFYQYPNVARQWYDSLPKATLTNARKEEEK